MVKNYKFTTKEEREFKGFLNKTIIGTSYNFFNKRKKYVERHDMYEDNIVVDSPKELGLFEEIYNEYLDKALKSLTEYERLVISFSYESNFKGTEIAEKLKITPNTLYKFRKRILEKLKKKIERMIKDEKN